MAVLASTIAGCTFLKGLAGPKLEVEPEPTPLTSSLAGKVVFARDTIPKETASEAGFVDTIELGQPLHARVYFDTSIGQRAVEGGDKCLIAGYSVEARLPEADWRHLQSFTVTSKESIGAWTSIRIDAEEHGSLMPTEAQAFPADRGDIDYAFAALLVETLQVGRNPVELRVTSRCENPRGFEAQGSGKVDIHVASAEALSAWREQIGPTLKSAPHPEAAQLLAGVRANWEASEGELLDVSVLGSSWNIERHPGTGLPLRRDVPVAVVVREKDSCVARVGFVVSEHDGNGYAPPGLFWNLQSSKSRFPCVAVRAHEPPPPPETPDGPDAAP